MHMRMSACIAILSFAAFPLSIDGVVGPGLGNLNYQPEEVGRPISFIITREGHSQVTMHRGYLIIIYSKDGGMGEGGIATVDVSNPRNPTIVHVEDNATTQQIREGHAWGFRDDVMCVQADSGVQFWDYKNPLSPQLLSYLRVKGVKRSDYDHGLWWTHWQGRYVYAGGTSRGLIILDALDPKNPRYVKTIPIAQTGGFRIGSVNVVGNLLAATGFDDGPSGISLFDISDPLQPNLLKTIPGVSSYASLINGNKLVLGARQTPRNGATVYDISDPSSPYRIGKPKLEDSAGGGYVGFDGGHAFVGKKNGFYKYDLNHLDMPLVLHGGSGLPRVDEGFPTPLGNLVFSGNDISGAGSALIPHQTERDVLGPMVNMVVPSDGSIYNALTSRVGLTFTDYLDGLSIDTSSIVIRPIGKARLKGFFAHQTGIVNFHPESVLEPNTTYEVIVPAGGVRDYMGNPSPKEFRSTFSTGNIIRDCRLEGSTKSVLGDTATFQLRCTGLAASDTVTWDFNDVSPISRLPLFEQLSHTFSKSGTFQVTVSIPALGKVLSLRHLVLANPTTTKPAHTSSIIHDGWSRTIWNVNTDNNSVTRSSAIDLKPLNEIYTGKSPRTIAMDPRGNVWVVNQNSATLTIIVDSTSNLDTIPLPRASRPFGITFNPQGNRAYVTLEGTGELLSINPMTRRVNARVRTVPTPRGIAISSDGNRVFVTRFISDSAHGEIAEHDGNSLSLIRVIRLEEDFITDTDNSGSGVPNALSSITISPDGTTAWVPFKKDNTRRGMFRGTPKLPLTFENTVRTGLAQIDLRANQEQRSKRLDFDNRSMANAVIFDPTGQFAYITTGASNHTVVVNTVTNKTVTAIEPNDIDAELAPDGMAMTEDGELLFIHYTMSRQIAVHDVTDVGHTNLAPRRYLFKTIFKESLSKDVLRGKQIFHNAHDPRMSRDRYISCAVCHMDGGSDRRVWDFTHKGEGLRRTTSLIGKSGLQQGPLHWTANFDEIQDFEHDIRGDFAGSGFLPDDLYHSSNRDNPLGGKKAGFSVELDALAAYLRSLHTPRPSPFRNESGALTPDAIAGREIFHSPRTMCSSCHLGPSYTNSTLKTSITAKNLPRTFLTPEGYPLYDVGTQKNGTGTRNHMPFRGFDTPTLLGVWEGGPYLHDGSARTLMDVLTVNNPDDLHGVTSHLSTKEKEQLVAFLLQVEGADDERPPSVGVRFQSHLGHLKRGGMHFFSLNSDIKDATLDLYTASGDHVITLHAQPGSNTAFVWDGRTSGRLPLSTGIFYARVVQKTRVLATGSFTLVP